MPAVWEQRFAEYVRRLLSLRESTALEALPDLMPVLPVLDPGAPENKLLRRERRFGQAMTQAASGAGNYGHVMLDVPATAGNVIAVVDFCRAVQGTGPFRATLTFAASGATLSGKNLDLRGGPTGAFTGAQSQAKYRADFSASLNGSFFWRWTNNQDAPPPVVLGPNTFLQVQNETANELFTLAFSWYERTVDPAELSPTGV